MPQGDQKLAVDAGVWLGNVLTSVAIIFVTKILMSVYHFPFATTVCGLHFLSCALAIWLASLFGWVDRPPNISFKHKIIFSLTGSVSIASANFSLLLNSVGFYQIAKLILAPFVCGMEVLWLGKKFSLPVICCIGCVLAGVAIVTVTDVLVKPIGLIMALIFIVSSGLQQILCGKFQSMLQISAHELLANTSPVQGTILLLAGPFVDRAVTGKWIMDWEINIPALELLTISCVVAIAVNLSQFLCLGRFTATSFQVLGHAKTLVVLFGGWLIFHETISGKQLAGIVLAVMGMILYGYFMAKAQPKHPSSPRPDAEVVPGESGWEKKELVGGERAPLLADVKADSPLKRGAL